jgi:peptidoglycan/LPS O-acetylase OafA/YrhL
MTSLLHPGPTSVVAPSENGSMEGRVWFAQMLRGIAALCVVYFHLAELYWKDNAYISPSANLTPLGIGQHLPWHVRLTGFLGHNRLELGDFGVAVFFLISGFVIPFSLAKVGGPVFLVRRIFRIYPTYIVTLVLTCLVLAFDSRLTGLPLGFGWWDFLSNAALLFDIFPAASIDPVNWTLIVEMRFYLLCVLLALFCPLRNWKVLAGAVAALCVANFFVIHNVAWLGVKAAYLPYLIFMCLGVCYHHLFQGDWTPMTFGLMLAVVGFCFYASVATMTPQLWRTRVIHAYTAAFLVFSLIYYYRGALKPNGVLDFFAQISFPLYLIHCTLGYSLMFLFYHWYPAPFLNFLGALVIILPLAWLLHVAVEVPSNRLGHGLTRRNSGLGRWLTGLQARFFRLHSSPSHEL